MNQLLVSLAEGAEPGKVADRILCFRGVSEVDEKFNLAEQRDEAASEALEKYKQEKAISAEEKVSSDSDKCEALDEALEEIGRLAWQYEDLLAIDCPMRKIRELAEKAVGRKMNDKARCETQMLRLCDIGVVMQDPSEVAGVADAVLDMVGVGKVSF